MTTQNRPVMLAGSPATNLAVYRRIRFLCGDPVVLIVLPSGPMAGANLIIRDVELSRARKSARADRFFSPADFPPPGGLSGDRPTATAQAGAEFLRRQGVREIWCDRSLPMLYAHIAREAGITVHCDPEMGVMERRSKDAQEVEFLRKAQRITEDAIEMACRLIASAQTDRNGTLIHEGQPLTSERVREELDIFLLRRGFSNPEAIIAGGPQGGDCHDRGTGPLRTEQPIIVDVFPCDRSTLYNGDCTRMVAHGNPANIPEEVTRMHAAVVESKRAAVNATRAGITGEAVHKAATDVILKHGYKLGLPQPNDPPSYCAMVHGTGHGIGLENKEPPLLDRGGPVLVTGDAVTIEPGLYRLDLGGIRIEDMVIVTPDGCDNLNQLHEGLTWT